MRPFPGRENCDYNDRGFTCKVPAGPVFHDGRQSRQQRRQPLLGIRSGRPHPRQGVLHLVQLGRHFESSRSSGSAAGSGERGRGRGRRNDDYNATAAARAVDDRLPVRRGGMLIVRAARVPDDSRLHRVLHDPEGAGSGAGRCQRFVDWPASAARWIASFPPTTPMPLRRRMSQ